MKKARETSNSGDEIERKKAASVMMESGKAFRTIFDNAVDGILVADVESKKFRLANKAMCRILGYNREELINLQVADIHPSESLPNVIAQFGKGTQGISPAENIPMKRKDGSVFYADINSSIIVLGGRKHLVGIFRDIAARKKAEKEISALSKFPSENPSPVLRIAKNGEILYSNKPGLELLAHWNAKIGEKAPEKWRRLIKETLESAKPGSQEEEEEEAKDRIFLIAISPVLEAGYVNLYGRDITESKKTQDALLKSHEQFKKIFDLSPDGMVISTVDEGRFLAINNAMLSIFGGAREKTIGHTARELNIWNDPAERDLMVKTLIKQKVVLNSEVVLRRRSGELFCAALSAGFIDYEGKKCLIVTVRDVDKLKKIEEALGKAYSELEADKKLLTEKNIAFQEVIKEIEIEKNALKDSVIANANNVILPILKKIRLKDETSRKYLDLLEKSLDALTSSFGRNLTVANLKLTPKEIEVCNMVRSGLTTKEISELLNLSSQTLDQHRKNIRKKLGLSHKGTNLTTYLQNL